MTKEAKEIHDLKVDIFSSAEKKQFANLVGLLMKLQQKITEKRRKSTRTS
jgi:hypothetical protein